MGNTLPFFIQTKHLKTTTLVGFTGKIFAQSKITLRDYNNNTMHKKLIMQ